MASIAYDRPERRPCPQLQARDLEIMRALWRYRLLTTAQIGEEWWSGHHSSRPQIRLSELTAAGLVARFRPLVRRGTHQWIYQLAREGFRAGQRHDGPDGPYIDEAARWSDRRVVDMRRVEHELRVNGWVLAYRRLLGGKLMDWLGPREARTGEGASATAPDAALLLELDRHGAQAEILVELARPERPVRLVERLRRYERLVTDGWQAVPRLAAAGQPPAVVLLADGYRHVDRLLRAADEVLSGAGRTRLIVCAEADIQRASTRGWSLPAAPPSQRGTPEFTATEMRLPS